MSKPDDYNQEVCGWEKNSETEYSNNNFEIAFFWSHKAAQKGGGKGAFITACCYLTGNGVEKNRELALYWLQKSITSSQPFGSAYRILGNGLACKTLANKDDISLNPFDRFERTLQYFLYAIELGVLDAFADATNWLDKFSLTSEEKLSVYTFYVDILDSPNIDKTFAETVRTQQQILGSPVTFLN